jgi:hypothetical protein
VQEPEYHCPTFASRAFIWGALVTIWLILGSSVAAAIYWLGSLLYR